MEEVIGMRNKQKKLKKRKIISTVMTVIFILAVISASALMLLKARGMESELTKFLSLNSSLRNDVEALTQSVNDLQYEN